MRVWKLAGQQCERKASGLAANRLGSVGATVSASTITTSPLIYECSTQAVGRSWREEYPNFQYHPRLMKTHSIDLIGKDIMKTDLLYLLIESFVQEYSRNV